MSVVELHSRSVAEFGWRVEHVGEDQWARPTPCTDWNVRELVNHLVNENRWTLPLLRGQTIAEVGDRFDGDLLGDDPKAEWRAAASEATGAVAEPGALERTVHLSFGDHPGEEYAWQLMLDHVIHAWDLARGIGADETLEPELVDVCFERFKPQEDMLKSFGVYGAKVVPPPGADRQTQLLAVFGRTP